MEIVIKPHRIAKGLGLFVAALAVAHLLTLLSIFWFGHPTVYGLIRLFNFDQEQNVPSFYSSSTLLLCAGLLAVIAHVKRNTVDRYWRHWLGLAAIFLFLAVDEASSVHELLIGPTRDHFHFSGLLYFAWVVPYALALIAFGSLYLPFVWALPPRSRALFVVAGIVFVSGAIGMELVGGRELERHGVTLLYAMYYTTEEMLEMGGILLFIHALLDYIATHAAVQIRIDAVDDIEQAATMVFNPAVSAPPATLSGSEMILTHHSRALHELPGSNRVGLIEKRRRLG